MNNLSTAITALTLAIFITFASSSNTGASGTSVIQISNSQMGNNGGSGVRNSTGGILETFQNNSIVGNGNNTCGGGGGACTPKAPGQ